MLNDRGNMASNHVITSDHEIHECPRLFNNHHKQDGCSRDSFS